MTWPTTQTTNSLDADTDTLQNARPEVKGLADKFNLLVAHVTAFMQGLLSSATAADARTTLDVPSRNGAGATGTSWGIGITGNAATATTAANVSRSVTGAGLATGGGALSADQTITVTKATQAQAEAGADDATAMTPLRTAQALAFRSLGLAGTYQDVSSSRTWATAYQNTNPYPILVIVQGRSNTSNARYLQVSANGSTWVNVGMFPGVGAADNVRVGGWAVVKPGHYYRVDDTLGSLNIWTELR